jgi:hypothetical protein
MSIESLNAFSMNFFSLKVKRRLSPGNSGLGQAFAMALAKAGANLFIPSFVKDNGETRKSLKSRVLRLSLCRWILPKGAPGRLSLPAASALYGGYSGQQRRDL